MSGAGIIPVPGLFKERMMNITLEKYNRRKKFLSALLVTGILVMAICPMAFAAGDSSAITGKIDALKGLVLGIIQSAGAIVLLWGIFEFASAYQSHDTTQQTASLKKVISGILMVAAGTIVSIVS